MKTIKLVVVILLMIHDIALGQDKEDKLFHTAGIELDLLPYMSGGYYASIWYGLNHLRIRPVIAKVNTPSFLLEDGFKNGSTKAYA